MDPRSQLPLPDRPAPRWDHYRTLTPVPAAGPFVVIAFGIAVIVIAGFVAVATQRSPTGNVYFSKTAYDTNSGTCQFDSPATTLSTGDHVYLIAAFNDAMQVQDKYTLEIVKDGVSLGTTDVTADTKFNCYVEQGSLGPMSAGVYRFTFKHNGQIEAEGTLVVK